MKHCSIKSCKNKYQLRGYCRTHYQEMRANGSLEYIGSRVNPFGVKIIQLHQAGMSTAEIARRFGIKKNTILCYLRNRGLLRKNLGFEIEQKAIEWYTKNGIHVTPQRGDAPFDILVQGKRIDVKSARLSANNRYVFAIQHKNSLHRKTAKDLDTLLLVFKDMEKMPMYLLDFNYIEQKTTFAINFSKPTYPMQYLGCLER